jgi:hypothetical protein
MEKNKMKTNLNSLETIITGLDYYKTRAGKIVVINKIVPESGDKERLQFNCLANVYNNRGDIVTAKSYHKSGRVSQYSESPLDIVGVVE